MSVIRWRPFQDMLTLREAMDELFERSFIKPGQATMSAVGAGLPMNVWEDNEALHIVAEVPGLKAEDLEITTNGDALTVRGEFKGAEPEGEVKRWYFHELGRGAFERTLVLPGGVETGKAEAEVTSGLLHISLPKAEEARLKTIKVKSS